MVVEGGRGDYTPCQMPDKGMRNGIRILFDFWQFQVYIGQYM